MKNPNRSKKSALFIWWLILYAIACIIIFLIKPEQMIMYICFGAALPVTLILTEILLSISYSVWSKKYRTIQQLIDEYGPGQKCADELQNLLIGEKSPAMKNRCIYALSSVYLEMGEPEKAIDTLFRMDKTALFEDKSDPLRPYYEADYQLLMMKAYQMKKDYDEVINIYKENLGLFKHAYRNKADIIKMQTIEYIVEDCVGNYEKCLEILDEVDSSQDAVLDTKVQLDRADLFIKTGRTEEAADILRSIKHNISGVSNTKIYEQCCNEVRRIRAENKLTTK